ncbi:hypothetical protein ACIOBL_09940 [Paenibacillus taichungensis]
MQLFQGLGVSDLTFRRVKSKVLNILGSALGLEVYIELKEEIGVG